MSFIDSLKQYKEYDYCKKKIKKDFNKNLVMSEKMNKYVNQTISVGYVMN